MKIIFRKYIEIKSIVTRSPFLKTIVTIGFIALALLLIYSIGKSVGKFFATY